MVKRNFCSDKDSGITSLYASDYRGISREISSEEEVVKKITKFTLCLLYEFPLLHSCGVYATSHCSPEDEYDEKKGKEVCNVKADLKYHKKMYDRYLKVAWMLRRVSNRLMDYVNMHQEKIERLEKDLDQYQK